LASTIWLSSSGHAWVGLPGGLALQILANRGTQRVEVLEVAGFTGQSVVQRRELLPLYVMGSRASAGEPCGGGR
jgi:hypothetical protein